MNIATNHSENKIKIHNYPIKWTKPRQKFSPNVKNCYIKFQLIKILKQSVELLKRYISYILLVGKSKPQLNSTKHSKHSGYVGFCLRKYLLPPSSFILLYVIIQKTIKVGCNKLEPSTYVCSDFLFLTLIH